MAFLADHMIGFILASLGLTFAIAVALQIVGPTRKRFWIFLSQILGWASTCFIVSWIGLQLPIAHSLAFALLGAAVGAAATLRLIGYFDQADDLVRRWPK